MSLKGVILAGGTGSRLLPLTKVTNKHLLPIGRKPMIYYPIEKMLSAGIEEILIVTGVEHMGDVVTLLGSGKDFGCRFTYKVQDEAGGIAQALGLAENFAAGQPVMVILGDNIFQSDLKGYTKKFAAQKTGAMVLLKEVEDPHRFGVAQLNGDKVIGIVEKPKEPKTNLAVIGVYFYDSTVFNIIKTLKPSKRGELEVTDINNAYIKKNQMCFDVIEGWWSDAGTFESLARVNQLISQQGKI
jgi:glucose-1-phosphate thymidylyltransferase